MFIESELASIASMTALVQNGSLFMNRALQGKSVTSMVPSSSVSESDTQPEDSMKSSFGPPSRRSSGGSKPVLARNPDGKFRTKRPEERVSRGKSPKKRIRRNSRNNKTGVLDRHRSSVSSRTSLASTSDAGECTSTDNAEPVPLAMSRKNGPHTASQLIATSAASTLLAMSAGFGSPQKQQYGTEQQQQQQYSEYGQSPHQYHHYHHQQHEQQYQQHGQQYQQYHQPQHHQLQEQQEQQPQHQHQYQYNHVVSSDNASSTDANSARSTPYTSSTSVSEQSAQQYNHNQQQQHESLNTSVKYTIVRSVMIQCEWEGCQAMFGDMKVFEQHCQQHASGEYHSHTSEADNGMEA
eukprot:Clim_evm99s210 gene=Clim_evmTU99s210